MLTDPYSYFVTPFRAAALLQDEVVGRAVRARGKTKPQAVGNTQAPIEPGVPQPATRTIGHKSLMRYVEALVRLWNKQGQSQGNTAPHPREGPVSTIIDTVKRTKAISDRENYADKLVGTYVDGLANPELIARMADHGSNATTTKVFETEA